MNRIELNTSKDGFTGRTKEQQKNSFSSDKTMGFHGDLKLKSRYFCGGSRGGALGGPSSIFSDPEKCRHNSVRSCAMVLIRSIVSGSSL
jgi:hypothetical protein